MLNFVVSNESESEEIFLLEEEEARVGDISFIFNAKPDENKKYVLFRLMMEILQLLQMLIF